MLLRYRKVWRIRQRTFEEWLVNAGPNVDLISRSNKLRTPISCACSVGRRTQGGNCLNLRFSARDFYAFRFARMYESAVDIFRRYNRVIYIVSLGEE